MAKLTNRQKQFVAEYLVDLNATAAAKRAGYKDPNKGRQLVAKGNVAEAIQKAIQDREQRTQITQDMVVRELAKVAFANGAAYARVTGGGRQVELTDTQTVADAADLTGNTWVDFKKDATLAATAGMPLTGGADAEGVTGDSHQAFLDKIEPYAFNALCCPAADPTIVKLYATYTERMRDEVGAKFQLVAWQPSTVDYEGVIGVWNTATHPAIQDVDEHAIVYWATGAQAGVAVNKSLTNAKYDGELVLNTEYTNAQYTAAIKAGKFMFYNDNGTTRILEDINTLRTLSDTKGEDFQSCQTMRVCDQIANDAAVIFGTKYLGTVQNDASGRSALWGDVTHYIGDLEKIRAVQNFDPDTVTCEQGDKKKAVLLTLNGMDITNAMALLYMSVIIK